MVPKKCLVVLILYKGFLNKFKLPKHATLEVAIVTLWEISKYVLGVRMLRGCLHHGPWSRPKAL